MPDKPTAKYVHTDDHKGFIYQCLPCMCIYIDQCRHELSVNDARSLANDLLIEIAKADEYKERR